MYCKNCGAQMNDNQVVCLSCGCQAGTGVTFCANCGGQLNPGAIACMRCGVAANYGVVTRGGRPNNNMNSGYVQAPVNPKDAWVPAGKDKIVCILLCFFLGGLGIHNFYMGENKKGVLRLVLGLTSFLIIPAIVVTVFVWMDFIKMLIGSYTYDPEALI